jgi:colanic acid biosynthesis glycosyl transferase WcaI
MPGESRWCGDVASHPMPRLIFVNRFFYPDHSATSQILSDLAFHLGEAGFDVQVLTSRQIYDDPARVLPARESVRGVLVHRVWATRFGRSKLLRRAVDYLTFYLSATVKLATLADSGAVVIAETDPPLLSVPCALVARLKRSALVNWTQDLFPEIAEGLHVPGIALVAPALRWLRNLSLKRARTNVVLGEGMAARLRAEGVAPDKIEVIHNWSPVEMDTRSAGPAAKPLRGEWNLAQKFVVGYSGNLGRAHDFATVLDAAAMLRNLPDVHFLFVGAGAQRAWVEARVAHLGLTNVSFQPYQPLHRLGLSLSVPDVHLVSLKPELEGLIVPSKFYSVLAAGRPMLFVGDPNGEIAMRIEKAGCGRAFSVGAHADLTAAIRELAGRPAQVAEMGERARALWASLPAQARSGDLAGAVDETVHRHNRMNIPGCNDANGDRSERGLNRAIPYGKNALFFYRKTLSGIHCFTRSCGSHRLQIFHMS